MSVTNTPVTAVWEITMGCNLRCMHCGSICEGALPGELTTDEALAACDSMGRLGMRWVTLSGGEPLTRSDWPQIARRLRDNGVIPNMISNGWMLTDEVAEKIRGAGIGTMALSLDGLQSTHDKIRKEGSFVRVRKAFEALRKVGVFTGVITTLNRLNIDELPRLRETLEEWGVNSWQVQLGLPMGNMAEHGDIILPGDCVQGILDFCLETSRQGRIRMYPADCIGYFTPEEEETRQICMQTDGPVRWEGCNAGKRSFGLLHNGDVVGCTSIRDHAFMEGSIRQRPLEEIWNDSDAFGWARGMCRQSLGGECRTCRHGDACLGGCPNSRLTLNGTLYSEAPWCAFGESTRRAREVMRKFEDSSLLLERARQYLAEGNDALAVLVLDRAVELGGVDVEALALRAFAHFRMGHYDLCEEANLKVLQAAPRHSYAMNGLGLAMVHSGRAQEGLVWMEKAVENAGPEFPDPGVDLALVRARLQTR